MHRRDVLKLGASFAAIPVVIPSAWAQQAAKPNGRPAVFFFRQVKSLTSKIYYATEIGTRELNKGGRAPASLRCAHGSHA
jgi:hypothetical protein